MKIAELRELRTEELFLELERLRRHLFDLRSQAVTEKLSNPYEVTAGKRDVARILTVLGERDVKRVDESRYRFDGVPDAHRARRDQE